jgi:hypothetical protein
MKCTPVDAHGLDVVLEPLANGRVFRAREKLQNRSYGFPQSSKRQVDFHLPGACHQPEPLKALFFPSREHTGSSYETAGRVLWACHDKYSCFCHLGGPAKWL